MTNIQLENLKLFIQPYFSSKVFNEYINYQDKYNYAIRIIKTIFSMTNNIFDGLEIDDPDLHQFISEMLHVDGPPPVVFRKKEYKPWLNDYRKEIDWLFWNRYQKYLLTQKNWAWDSISDIDKATDIIIDHLCYPKNEQGFRIKGLVMGDIQSGKTANYTGLINKAVDIGFKLVIVLAGLTNDLRHQTQIRLDKEFIGKITKDNQEGGLPTGVGTIEAPTGKYRVQSFTYADETAVMGDFKKMTSMIPIDNEMPPTLLVVKKNVSVLNNVINYLKKNSKHNDGKLNIPVLIIDDEVDQASVNTKKGDKLEDASSINKLIRSMMNLLNKYAYVGYTATPFANVFINTNAQFEEEKDIFPEDFIICLPTPKEYHGIRDFFGDINIDEENDVKTDLIFSINDETELSNFLKQEEYDLPLSMIDSFMHFIIASAVKRSRGIIEHNTMLIHVSSKKMAANRLKPLVEDYLSNMYRLYKFDIEERKRYLDYWESNLKVQSQGYLGKSSTDNWSNIENEILTVFDMLKNEIKVLNSDSSDYIDYESTKQGQHIAIGGNKLSRGLTLEGLITSYYFRRTNAYDTLMQMGRWFGYRKGWIDLCRIYTSSRIKTDFLNVADAVESFKQNILEMNFKDMTPMGFAVRVLTLPQLAPTSLSKMRNARKIKVAYSNTLQQTITFDLREKNNNRLALSKFIRTLGQPRIRKNKKIVFSGITSNKIINFLNDYKESEEHSNRISVKYWINYINLANSIDELTDWTVVLSSKNRDEAIDIIEGYKIAKSKRSRRIKSAEPYIVQTRAISDPADFREFYEEDTHLYKTIESFSQFNDEIIETFTPKHGLISIYVIDLYNKEDNKNQNWDNPVINGDGVIGLAVWFPKSLRESEISIDYYINERFSKNILTDIYEDDTDD
jgi:hypothetical protein